MGLKRNIKKIRRKYFPSDFEVMLEKWKAAEGDYTLRFDYDLDADSLVLDLGGYHGQWTSDLFSRYQCRVMIFEPVSKYAETIRNRFQLNSKIELYQYGLGASSRLEIMGISDDGSSLFKNTHETEEIEIVDVKKWFEGMDTHKIDLMKINIEGGEYELLERMIESGIVKNIINLQVQFHNIDTQSATRMKEIQNRLEKTHLPTYQYRFVWENWRRKSNM